MEGVGGRTIGDMDESCGDEKAGPRCVGRIGVASAAPSLVDCERATAAADASSSTHALDELTPAAAAALYDGGASASAAAAGAVSGSGTNWWLECAASARDEVGEASCRGRARRRTRAGRWLRL